MLESEALRIEEQLDFEPPVFDAGDYRFRPVAECAFCDEPFERGYNCTSGKGTSMHCDAPLCSNCVSAPARFFEEKPRPRLEDCALCPSCPGACSEYYPEVTQL